VNARVARIRAGNGATHTTQDNIVYLHRLGRQAREARRIAELLGPAGLVFLRDLLAVSS